jgi:hypothetical protein
MAVETSSRFQNTNLLSQGDVGLHGRAEIDGHDVLLLTDFLDPSGDLTIELKNFPVFNAFRSQPFFQIGYDLTGFTFLASIDRT